MYVHTLWEVIEEVQIIQSWIFISVHSQPRKFSCCFVLTNETFLAEMKSMYGNKNNSNIPYFLPTVYFILSIYVPDSRS